MSAESVPSFAPFSSIEFKGASVQNGKPINRSNAGYKNFGGFIDSADSNNSGLTASFGLVVSRNPAGTYVGALALGLPSTYVAAGIIQFNAGVAQNDPAKSNSELQGIPVTVIFEGGVEYQTWTNTQSGSHAVGAVLLTDIPIYRINATGSGAAAIGAVEFLAAGTAIPTGWAVLPASIVEIDDFGYVKLELNFPMPNNFQSAGFVTVGDYLKATTAGLAAMGGATTGYADDAAAAVAGVPVGGFYHTSGAVHVRRT